jgi:peptidoglycan-associated lipoprotein
LSKRNRATILFAVFLVFFAAGCKKKAPVAAAPPPPPPVVAPPPPAKAAAVVQFTAEPASIERGQAATLRWSVTDANSVTIEPGLGTVQSNGNRQVFPSSTTTYVLTATGAGGNAKATTTVNVTVPPAPPPPPPQNRTSFGQALEQQVADALFDYDSSDIREDARSVLTRNADALKAIMQGYPGSTVVVEGHCDDRGSAEYNLGLGDRRATAAKEFLTQLGVAPDKLKTISYGKERPQCNDANEGCWQKNRRAHFAPGQ